MKAVEVCANGKSAKVIQPTMETSCREAGLLGLQVDDRLHVIPVHYLAAVVLNEVS
jgi:hypothetical protein